MTCPIILHFDLRKKPRQTHGLAGLLYFHLIIYTPSGRICSPSSEDAWLDDGLAGHH